jgi:hypothetical protein
MVKGLWRRPPGRSVLHFGVTGQVRLNAEMARSPGAEDGHGLDEFLAGTGKRVGDLRRRRVRNLAADDAVSLELTKLSRQDFFADARQKFAELGEALGAEAQMPYGQNLPFPADGINRSLYGATVMVLQEPSGLTKMCVLPEGTRWLYHSSRSKNLVHGRECRAPRCSRRVHLKEAET